MRKRNNRIVFYLTDEECSTLNNKIVKSGLSREEFIRRTLAGKKIIEQPPLELHDMIFQLRRVGYNLNQLLRIANSEKFLDVPKTRTCIEEIFSLERAIHRQFFKPKEDG